jgi:beta-mannanase
VYEPGVPAGMSSLTSLESQIGARAAVLNFFISDGESFPLPRVQNAAAHGSTPMVTLEFTSTQTGGLAAFNAGSKDAYLTNFADAAKAYGGTVWLRPFHEMNGNWYPWGGTVGGNTPAQVVAAYRHVHDIFAARGATNVKFVWCVNADSVPNTTANSIKSYWPGDAYVDYPSIDGYNFGTYSGGSWRTFSSVMGAAYASVTPLTSKPIVIAETGCVEQGGSKAAWVADMFSSITTKYPRIAGVCWFDQLKGEDWRITSSATSLSAFKTAIAQGF